MVSPIIGTMLLVGLCFVQFSIALGAVPWTFGERDSIDLPFNTDPWTYCQAHPFEEPACRDGVPVPSRDDSALWCRSVVGRSVEHTARGIEFVDVPSMHCLGYQPRPEV